MFTEMHLFFLFFFFLAHLIPIAMVLGFCQTAAFSVPSSNARTMGAHPDACTATILGNFASAGSSPTSCSSRNPFHIPSVAKKKKRKKKHQKKIVGKRKIEGASRLTNEPGATASGVENNIR
jgi:hypothetical protein